MSESDGEATGPPVTLEALSASTGPERLSRPRTTERTYPGPIASPMSIATMPSVATIQTMVRTQGIPAA